MSRIADFQSSKTAQEIETVLTGAVLFNTGTNLTEAQKAQARENIGATSYGEGIKILSHFDTLAELETAITAPSPGDSYSVGESLPYNLYIFDLLLSEWKDYGPIRSTDLSARFAQDITVAAADWEKDETVFVDYLYKAKIPIGEVTGKDFPIVALAPSDATGGNFGPIAFSFDGYVEIWARTIPAGIITIPAITFIVQDDGAEGGSTKGITNASGGIPTGGIGTAQLADSSVTGEKIAGGAVSQIYTATVAAAAWSGDTAPYTAEAAVDGILSSDTPDIDLVASDIFTDAEAQIEAWGYIYKAVTKAGAITFYATERPTVELPIQIRAVRK